MGNLVSNLTSTLSTLVIVVLAIVCGVTLYRKTTEGGGGVLCCGDGGSSSSDASVSVGGSGPSGGSVSDSGLVDQAQLEFRAIEIASFGRGSFDHALLAHNGVKNRYSNVLANTDSRVLLRADDAVQDYINANYIRFHTAHDGDDSDTDALSLSDNNDTPLSAHTRTQPQLPVYIATQAPLSNTLADFWQMVFEQRSAVIVMLTKLEESGREKAHMYWPNAPDNWIEYGSVEVLLEREDVINEEITLRFLHLRKDKEEHTVTQIHYIGWPDFGIPESTDTFRNLIQMIDVHNSMPVTPGSHSSDNGPIITHCSAGIGRTGTLIAAHTITHQLLQGVPQETIELKNIVSAMREQRSGMVQTVGQYQFLLALMRDLVALHPGGVQAPSN